MVWCGFQQSACHILSHLLTAVEAGLLLCFFSLFSTVLGGVRGQESTDSKCLWSDHSDPVILLLSICSPCSSFHLLSFVLICSQFVQHVVQIQIQSVLGRRHVFGPESLLSQLRIESSRTARNDRRLKRAKQFRKAVLEGWFSMQRRFYTNCVLLELPAWLLRIWQSLKIQGSKIDRILLVLIRLWRVLFIATLLANMFEPFEICCARLPLSWTLKGVRLVRKLTIRFGRYFLQLYKQSWRCSYHDLDFVVTTLVMYS